MHRYVAREPSGRNFNELTLNDHGKPHNPMINAGAIMTSALVEAQLDNADRFDFVLDRWQAIYRCAVGLGRLDRLGRVRQRRRTALGGQPQGDVFDTLAQTV